MVAYGDMRARVAITGLGCVSSLGFTAQEFWDALIAGRSGITEITAFDTTDCRSHLAGKLRGFDPARYINPAKLRRIDEVGRVAIAACRLALEDAGLTPGTDGDDGIGVSLGTYTAGIHSTLEYLDGFGKMGPAGAPAILFSNTVGNAPASLCAIEFGLRGPNATLSHKEASALAAIAYAADAVARGRARAMVAGGADDISEMFFKIHNQFPILSPNDGGEEAARPFDASRNGFVLGEGGFLLVFERWEDATARGARPYGELLAIGASSSPGRINAWPDEPSQLARCMRDSIARADLTPSAIDLVLAAANGTKQLDRVESEALSQVFGARGVPVVSIKGAIGECGASAGGSVIAALASLRAGCMPPTVGLRTLADDCPVDATDTPRPLTGTTALVNAFASGGTNYAIVVRAQPQ